MYSGTIIPDDQLSGIPDEISAHDKVVAIAILLNERLWFVDKPLVETRLLAVRAVCPAASVFRRGQRQAK
jgi:hypothetical protein